MGETDLRNADVLNDAIRSVFSFFDRPAYWLLGISYQLFFNVAMSTIISNDTILKFYNRVQLIIGVYMLFQLALIIIKGIVNPDDFTKSGGTASKFVVRIITVVFLFSTLVPMTGINPRNEFEEQIRDNGILFGTLYSLQYRLLANNTLGRLILGTSDKAPDYNNESEESQLTLKKTSNMFASAVLRGFYRINLVPDENREHDPDGKKNDEEINNNRVCPNMRNEVLEAYMQIDQDPQVIISLVTEKCNAGGVGQAIVNHLPIIHLIWGEERYAFTYMGIISTIVAIVFVFILGSFTIDVAVRAIKLSILRLIAPIPLISYLDPKASKDGAFNAWVKTLTSTYIDLFIRLSVVYFVIFLIQDIIANGLDIKVGNGILGVVSMIIIWIGLFIFAKQAPKFLRQAVGAKEGNFRLFGGFADMMSAVTAVGATAAGTIGSFNSNRRASRDADEANGRNANSFFNRGKHLLAGIAGGFSGARTGVAAAWNAKDHDGRAAMEAINKRNATVQAQGAAGSTVLGRAGSNFRRAFTGRDAYDIDARDLSKLKAIEAAGKDLHSYLEDRAVKKGAGYGLSHTYTDSTGTHTINVTLDQWKTARETAKQTGRTTFTVGGQTFDTFGSKASEVEGDLIAKAGAEWVSHTGGDDTLRQKMDTFRDSGGIDRMKKNLGPSYTAGVSEYDSNLVKNVFKGAGGDAVALEGSKKYQKHKADHGATGGGK